MVKIMKGFTILTLCSIFFIGLIGCEKKEAEKIVFDFGVEDVKYLEVFRYVNPSDAEKFVITNEDKIYNAMSTFTSIDCKVNEDEAVLEGAQVTSFRFYLAENTYTDVIYAEIGVKDGIIQSPMLFDYNTQADIGGVGLDLIAGISAEKVSRDELPYYE